MIHFTKAVRAGWNLTHGMINPQIQLRILQNRLRSFISSCHLVEFMKTGDSVLKL